MKKRKNVVPERVDEMKIKPVADHIFVTNWFGKKSIVAFTKQEYHAILNNREQMKSLHGPFPSREAAQMFCER